MRPLSALEAITPAWDHTSSLLLAPRDWRLLLKIGLVACLAALGGGGVNMNYPHAHHMHSASGLPITPIGLPLALTGLVVFALIAAIGLIIGLAFLYIGSRMQFVLFEVLLTRKTTIGPIWNRFGRVTWRWMGLRLLCLLALFICLAPIIVPGVLHFIHIFSALNGAPPPNILALAVDAFSYLVPIFFVLLAAAIVFTLLFDFGLPSVALENTSIDTTIQRVFSLLRAEPGQCLLYLLIRFLLAVGCGIAAQISLAIAAVLAAIPFGGLAAILYGTLHTAALAGKAFMIGGWVLLAAAFLALVISAAIMVLGYVHCFLGSYTLYFLGGRYPMLGQILEQNLPPASPTPAYPNPYPPYSPTPAGAQ